MEEKPENMALNQETSGEETAVETTPVVEEQTAEETPVESTEEASTEEAPVEETAQEEPKKGAQARIKELNGKVKSLSQKLKDLTGNGQPAPVYQPQINLDSGEVTPEQYRQHVLSEANSIVELQLKRSEAINRINTESSEVIKTYPQLDPDSDQFDPELSETISEAVEAQVKLNPFSVSVKKSVEKLMKPLTKGISDGVAKEKETLARQVSESALKPTNVHRQEKPFAEKTTEEMEAELGIVQT